MNCVNIRMHGATIEIMVQPIYTVSHVTYKRDIEAKEHSCLLADGLIQTHSLVNIVMTYKSLEGFSVFLNCFCKTFYALNGTNHL